jgi:hypothetical protein
VLISINLIKKGSFNLFNILNIQKFLDYKVKDIAKVMYSILSSIIIIGKS